MSANFIFIEIFRSNRKYCFLIEAKKCELCIVFLWPRLFVHWIDCNRQLIPFDNKIRALFSSLCSHSTPISGSFPWNFSFSLSPSSFYCTFSFRFHSFAHNFFFVHFCHSSALFQCDTLCSLFCYFSSSLSAWLRSRHSFWNEGERSELD